jgi:Ser-tRNA(Ala) deacylase AlaX
VGGVLALSPSLSVDRPKRTGEAPRLARWLLHHGIVDVGAFDVGLDLQADGAMHVANTREVGAIPVAGYQPNGRLSKRIPIELAPG